MYDRKREILERQLEVVLALRQNQWNILLWVEKLKTILVVFDLD